MTTAGGPRISVIVPTCNRAAAVRLCLSALAAQRVPPEDFEVVVVDDGSTDDTEAAAASRPALRVTYVRQENAGANAARNRAVNHAAAPLLLFVNDDTIADPGLLAVHLEAHAAAPDPRLAVLGRMTIHPDYARSPFSPLHHDASFAPLAGRDEVPWTSFFTCNVSVKAAFLAEVGGFDSALRWHEDIELGERMHRHGLRLLYRPEALGYHWHLLDERQLLRIAEREGEALVRWWRRRPDLLETLQGLGLSGPAPLHRPLRHSLADAAFAVTGERLPLRVAEAAAPVSPRLARMIWRKVFQTRKRRAIATAMKTLDCEKETV